MNTYYWRYFKHKYQMLLLHKIVDTSLQTIYLHNTEDMYRIMILHNANLNSQNAYLHDIKTIHKS